MGYWKASFAVGVALSLLACGCATKTVRPVAEGLEMNHVCIKDGESACWDGRMIGVIRDGFTRHGISTEIYNGNAPSQCEYNLLYMCERAWDMATYLRHAELRLYKGNTEIGYGEFHLRGGGGLDLTKFQSTKTKMDPIMDELLRSVRNNNKPSR